MPNKEPIQTAAKATRPSGPPLPRDGLQKWASAEFLCTTTELTRLATMLWSVIGGTTETGWIKSDEESWEEAIEIIKDGLRKTDGRL